MQALKYYYKKTLKNELVNKFLYKTTKNLPKIKKIVLNFGCKRLDLKQLSSSLLALELISKQKSILTKSKKINILLKIRKGNTTGCKVTLKKKHMFFFLSTFLFKILPKLPNLKKFNLNKKNVLSYRIAKTFSFEELEINYYLFDKIPILDITIISNAKNKEFIFILKFFKFPL
jgi:large subunit ribosomal protein L5